MTLRRPGVFFASALLTLRTGTAAEQRETIELLLLYRQRVEVPKQRAAEFCRALEDLLDSEDSSVRYWSACALGEFGSTASLPRLRAARRAERDRYVGDWMDAAISHLSGEQAEASKKLTSADPAHRAQAARVMFFDSSAETRRLLATQLADSDADAMAWKLLALPGPRQRLARASLLLGTDASGAPVPIGALPADMLRDLLLSGDPQTTEFALWNLALARDRGALERAQLLATDTSGLINDVRQWIYRYLGFVYDPSSLPVLKQAVERERDPTVLQAIAFALGRSRGRDAEEILTDRLLPDPDPGTRVWAARACGDLDQLVNPQPALVRALENEPDRRVLRELYRTLERRQGADPLKRFDLLERHASDERLQSDVLEYVLTLATAGRPAMANARLRELLRAVPVAPSLVVQEARAVAEEYGAVPHTYAMGDHLDLATDDVRRGFEFLFAAAATDPTDTVVRRHALENAAASFAGAASAPGETTSFYVDLARLFAGLLDAIADRRALHFEPAPARFAAARDRFELWARSDELRQTEQSLCRALASWCRAQAQVSDPSSRPDADHLALVLEVAAVQAADARRFRLVAALDALVADVRRDGPPPERALADVGNAWNAVLIAVPNALATPQALDELIVVDVTDNRSTSTRLDVTLTTAVDSPLPSALRDLVAIDLEFTGLGEPVSSVSIPVHDIGRRGDPGRHAIARDLEDRPPPSSVLSITVVARFEGRSWPLERRITVPLTTERPIASVPSVEFAIVTALQEEVLPILAHLDNVEPDLEEDVPLSYWRARVAAREGGHSHEVAVLCLFNKGNAPAAAATTRMLGRYRPNHVLMVGVAGGVPSSGVHPCDVVIGSQSFYYEAGKLRDGEFELQRDPLPADEVLRQRAQFYVVEGMRTGETWTDRLRKRPPLDEHHDPAPEYRVHEPGPIASGEKVIRDAERRDELADQCPGLLAVAMEGAGVARAALIDANRPSFLEVRAIMDYADKNKDDTWKEFAAEAAASFVAGFLRWFPGRATDEARA